MPPTQPVCDPALPSDQWACVGTCNGSVCVCRPGLNLEDELSFFHYQNCGQATGLLPIFLGVIFLISVFTHFAAAVAFPRSKGSARTVLRYVFISNGFVSASTFVALCQNYVGSPAYFVTVCFGIVFHVCCFLEIGVGLARATYAISQVPFPNAVAVERARLTALAMFCFPLLFLIVASAYADSDAEAYNFWGTVFIFIFPLHIFTMTPLVLRALNALISMMNNRLRDIHISDPGSSQAGKDLENSRKKLFDYRRMLIMSIVGELVLLEGLGAIILVLRPPFLSSILFMTLHILLGFSLLGFIRFVATDPEAKSSMSTPALERIPLGDTSFAIVEAGTITMCESDTLLYHVAGPRFAGLVLGMLRFIDGIRYITAMLTCVNLAIIIVLVLILAGQVPKPLSYVFALLATLPILIFFSLASHRVVQQYIRTSHFIALVLVLGAFLAAFADMVAYDERVCIGIALTMYSMFAGASDCLVDTAKNLTKQFVVGPFSISAALWAVLQFDLLPSYHNTIIAATAIPGSATFSVAQFCRDSCLAISLLLAEHAIFNLRSNLNRFVTITQHVNFVIVPRNMPATLSPGTPPAPASALQQRQTRPSLHGVSQLDVESGFLTRQGSYVQSIGIKQADALIVHISPSMADLYFGVLSPTRYQLLLLVGTLSLLICVILVVLEFSSAPMVTLVALLAIACFLLICLGMSWSLLKLLARRNEFLPSAALMVVLWAISGIVFKWDVRILVSFAFVCAMLVGYLIDSSVVSMGQDSQQLGFCSHQVRRIFVLCFFLATLSAFPLGLQWGLYAPYQDFIINVRADEASFTDGDSINQISLMQWSGDIGLALALVVAPRLSNALLLRRRGILASLSSPMRPLYIADVTGPRSSEILQHHSPEEVQSRASVRIRLYDLQSSKSESKESAAVDF